MKKGWQTKKLVDVATLQRGFDLPTQDRSSGDVPLVTSSGISDSVSKSAVHGPGVATGRSGSIGNVFFIEEDFWPLNTVLYVKDFHGNEPRFVFHLLKNFDLKRFATGAGVPTLNRNFVHDELVNVPPLADQQRIVGLLDEAFEGLATAKANAEKNLENARALFESHLQAVFTLRGPGWVEKTLGDICLVDWGNTDLTKSSYVEGGKFLAVSAAGCDGRIGHKEHAKHTPVLSAIGAQCGRMFLPDEDFTAIKNTITLTPRDGTCTGRFLYRLLTHVELPKRGAAQPFISKGDIQGFQVVVPKSLSVQQQMEEFLSELEAETQHLARLYERKQAALEALKKSLLHQAFTGEL